MVTAVSIRHRTLRLPSLLTREEGGQVMALLAFGIVGVLGLAAFTIDVGAWYQAQRQAQAAADAGATAAARDLPSNVSQAASDASTYVNKNTPVRPRPSLRRRAATRARSR
jgi:Flp pilus assembly protein TadG